MLQRSIKSLGECKRHVTTWQPEVGRAQETCDNVASSRWASARDMLQRGNQKLGERKRH